MKSKWWNEWRHFYKILFDRCSIKFGHAQSVIFRCRRSGGFLSFLFDTPISHNSVPYIAQTILMPIVLESIRSLTMLMCRWDDSVGKISARTQLSGDAWSMRCRIGIVLSIYSYWKPYVGNHSKFNDWKIMLARRIWKW